MKIGLYNSYEQLNQDSFYATGQPSLGDDLMCGAKELMHSLLEIGVEVSVVTSIEVVHSCDLLIVFDNFKPRSEIAKAVSEHSNKYLVVYEPPLIRPENHDVSILSDYLKVFTWNDQFLLQSTNAIKLRYPINWKNDFDLSLDRKSKIVAIYSNKRKSNSLYGLRKRVMDELSDHEFIDLYGLGWDERVLERGNRFTKIFPWLRSFRYSAPRYYKGKIERKFSTLAKYDFALVIENEDHTPGYVTEKLLDALNARCIPIYKGCKNLKVDLPENCFINLEHFSSATELVSFLRNNVDVQKMRRCIDSYVKSNKSYRFSSRNFAEIITSEVRKRLELHRNNVDG